MSFAFLKDFFPPEWVHILPIVCPLVFLAGFVDSIAGGGGLISLPAYLFAGLPIHLTLGTNKFAMMFGTSFSSFRYLKSKLVNLKVALFAVLAAFPGSWTGAQLALYLDARVMKGIMMIALPAVLIWMWVGRKRVKAAIDAKKALMASSVENTPAPASSKILILQSLAIGFAIGAYDGLIGPGTGTFLILAFTALIGMSTLTASGTAKWVNLASNVAAFVTFLLHGQVLFWVGIPAAVCAILGNMVGSHLAIKNGDKIIRPLLAVVVLLLIIKLGIDLVQ